MFYKDHVQCALFLQFFKSSFTNSYLNFSDENFFL